MFQVLSLLFWAITDSYCVGQAVFKLAALCLTLNIKIIGVHYYIQLNYQLCVFKISTISKSGSDVCLVSSGFFLVCLIC